MTTGAPPPNLTFQSSKRIMPSLNVQTFLYNAAGYIAHPLQHFGQVGGATTQPIFTKRSKPDVAGNTGNLPGGFAWNMGHPHTINGREPGNRY